MKIILDTTTHCEIFMKYVLAHYRIDGNGHAWTHCDTGKVVVPPTLNHLALGCLDNNTGSLQHGLSIIYSLGLSSGTITGPTPIHST